MDKKVLIVDDSEINRDILVEIVSDKYETLQAENGKEAIDILDNNRLLLGNIIPYNIITINEFSSGVLEYFQK